MNEAMETSAEFRKSLNEIRSLADTAVLGTLPETYRTVDRPVPCRQGGPTHGPAL